MKLFTCLTTYAVLAAFNLASIALGEEQSSEKIALDRVPAAIMKVANETEERVEWTEALLEASEHGNAQSRSFVLKGKIEIRPQRQKVLSDGDVEIIPGEYESVEVTVLSNGTLDMVIKSVPMDKAPQPVMAALKQKINVVPSSAYSVRFTATGQPEGYLFWIDADGRLQYYVSADGKRADKV